MTAFDRTQATVEAVAFASIPLFPSFITFTNVAFPGVSVIPFPFAIALFGAMMLLEVVFFSSLFLVSRREPVMLRPILVLLGTVVLSLLFGLNLRDGLVFAAIFALSLIWHLHIEGFYERPGVARAIWWSYLLSGTLACIVAIAMVVLRVPTAQYTIAHGRAVGTFVLPGELAGYLLFFVPIAYALARCAHAASLRALAWIACVAGLLTMALTFSRTGWIGLSAGIGFLVAVRSGTGRAGLIRGAAILLAALAIVLMLFNEHHNPSENYTRITIWQAAIGAIDRFPLTGVGPFGFSKIYPFVRLPNGDPTAFHAHSLYLTFLAELGVVGLLGFGWVLWNFARALHRQVLVATPSAAWLASAIAAGVVGALVQGLIDTVSVVIFGLLLSMLALAFAAARSGTVDA